MTPLQAGPLLGGVTVILVHSEVTGRDIYGNDVRTTVTTEVGGCAFVPGSGSAIGTTEDTRGTDQVVANAECYLPAGTVVTAEDKITYQGVTYEVDGAPGAWTSPFTGIAGPVMVHLRVITGASGRA